MIDETTDISSFTIMFHYEKVINRFITFVDSYKYVYGKKLLIKIMLMK